MNKQVAIISLASALALSGGAMQTTAAEKLFSLGGSLYLVDVDARDIATMDFSGGSIVGPRLHPELPICR